MTPGLRRGLVVSCQAETGSPFNAPGFILAFARAAELGGATAVRLSGARNIRIVRKSISLPIVGITKGTYPNGDVLITPSLKDIDAIIRAGASVVALDATRRKRADGVTGSKMVQMARNRFPALLIADISTLDEGIAAIEGGADFVATTLSGYTRYTREKKRTLPDLELVRHLAVRYPGKVIAEGGFWTPEHVRDAFTAGAFAVVVGTAITRPLEIVKRFVAATR